MVNKNYIVKVTLSKQTGVVKATWSEGMSSPFVPQRIKNNPNTNISFIKYGTDTQAHLYSSLEFDLTQISVIELAKRLMYGQCLGQIYNIEYPYKREYGLKYDKIWLGTQYVGIDIDDTIVPMDKMHDSLPFTPTFSMTTQSHMKGNHKNRYRLFYFFMQPITSYEGFKKISNVISDAVRNILREAGDSEKCLDTNVFNRSTFFFGNDGQCDFKESWQIYTTQHFVADYNDNETADMTATKVSYQTVINVNTDKLESPLLPIIWERMNHDICSPGITAETIATKYRRFYHLRFQTKVDAAPTSQTFIIPPENFIALRFRWENSKTPKGRRRKATVKRFRNGEHRRRLLWMQLNFVRHIHDYGLQIDQLVYHAFAIFNLAYSNLNDDGTQCTGDDVITPRMIRDIALEVLKKKPEEVIELIKKEIEKNRKQFMVNRDAAIEANISVLKLLGLARSEYYQSRWENYRELLKPYIKRGWSNRNLAKKLEELTGCNYTPKHVGKKIKDLRDYRKESHKKHENRGEKTPKQTKLGSFHSQIPSEETLPPHSYQESSKEMIKEIGSILSINPQSAVPNIGRKLDKQRRLEQFRRLYRDHETVTENLKRITKRLKISERTFYKYQKEVRK